MPPNAPETVTRGMAAAPHFLSIPFPVVGPLIVAIASAGRPAARYQALRAFLADLVVFALTATIVVVSIGHSLWTAWQTYRTGDDVNWIAMLVKSVAVWLGLAAFGLWNTVSSLLEGLAVLRGRDRPPQQWLDRLAARWSGWTGLPPSPAVAASPPPIPTAHGDDPLKQTLS